MRQDTSDNRNESSDERTWASKSFWNDSNLDPFVGAGILGRHAIRHNVKGTLGLF
jgi:hypothetical protein